MSRTHTAPGEDPGLARATDDLQRHARVGLALCLLLVFGVGGWAATARLAGAVIAPGVVVVDGNSKKVQHPSGGVVGEVRVRNGDRVQSGALLVRLDETQVRATLGVVQSQLVQSLARRARLAAERDGSDRISLPVGFETESAEAAEAAAGEQRLFKARLVSRAGVKSQVRERIRQSEQEIEGLESQLAAKKAEIDLNRSEMQRLEGLFEKQLVSETRMSQMRRDMVRLEGERGSFVAQIARAKAQVSQGELQILQVEQDAQTEVQKDLRETEARVGELMEKRTAALDQLKRVDIRAPIDGTVHELTVHTVGGVIQAGETLMLIVPSGDPLAVEARISPTEIDQVAIDRRAVLRFSAFNQRTTPEVSGTVSHVAADLSREAQTGATYFLVRIRLGDDAAEKLAGLRVVPGMPVEGFIETGERTALSYIVKPLADSVRRTFRER